MMILPGGFSAGIFFLSRLFNYADYTRLLHKRMTGAESGRGSGSVRDGLRTRPARAARGAKAAALIDKNA